MLGRLRAKWNREVDKYLLRVPPRAEDPYATHIPVLLAVGRLVRVKRVLELGSGEYSTALFLDRACFPQVEEVVSLENDKSWAERVRLKLAGENRLRLENVDGLMATAVGKLCLESFDLVFVDDSAVLPERVETIRMVSGLAPKRPVVLIHDFECVPYRKASAEFNHRYRFTSLNPNTGVAWNGAQLKISDLRKINASLKAPKTFALSDRAKWSSWLDKHLNNLWRGRAG